MIGSRWERHGGVFYMCMCAWGGVVVMLGRQRLNRGGGLSGFRLDEHTTEINVVYKET